MVPGHPEHMEPSIGTPAKTNDEDLTKRMEEPILLPVEIHTMIIQKVATDFHPETRVYPTEIRDTLRALCTVNKHFESVAIQHLYAIVHLTNVSQLAAFRKAIAYFGRPTELARYVRTFSISSATHIASFQFANDMITILYVLQPSLECLLLDVRRRHYFRQTPSYSARDVGILQSGPAYPGLVHLLGIPWPRLIEVSVSEGLDQYLHLPRLPRAFDNVRRLALGYTTITADLIDRLNGMPFLEVLVLVNSPVRWLDFGATSSDQLDQLAVKFSSLPRIVWIATEQPRWDMEEHMSINHVQHDAQMLDDLPNCEVIFHSEGTNTEDIQQNGLSGPYRLGMSVREGWIWRL